MSIAPKAPLLQHRPQRPPPLQNGDCLDRKEFERRFDATPGLKKAELIEGVVYTAPPVSATYHGSPHMWMTLWLATYRANTPGTFGGGNSSLRIDDLNEPQPDLFLMINRACGGQARVDDEGYVQGAVELAVEVAASTSSHDLHKKLRLYERVGVREYVVWRVYDEAIDWMVLREGKYRPLAAGADGVWRSKVFPGLWLAGDALLRDDMARVLAVLQDGIASPEHAAFVRRMAGKA